MLVLTVVSGVDYFVHARQQDPGAPARGGGPSKSARRGCGEARSSGVEQDGRRREAEAVRGRPSPGRVARGGPARASRRLPPVPGLRLLGPEQWHVTLAFIGEVGAAKAEIARKVVEGLPADMGGEASWSGSSCCRRPSRARVVTLELADEQRSVPGPVRGGHGGLGGRRGHAAGEEAVPAASHHREAPDARRSHDQGMRASGRGFAVQSVCLYESELRREGAVYTVVCRRTLGPGDVEGA